MTRLNSIKAAALAAALSLTTATTMVLADTGGTHGGDRAAHGGRGGGHGGHGAFFGDLNLSDAQKTQIQTIHENHRTATESLRQEMQAKRQELRQLTDGTSFDEALVRQKLTESA